MTERVEADGNERKGLKKKEGSEDGGWRGEEVKQWLRLAG